MVGLAEGHRYHGREGEDRRSWLEAMTMDRQTSDGASYGWRNKAPGWGRATRAAGEALVLGTWTDG